ncbi:hypothetical protein Pint_05663 [Pistacia integerrima]|uniref:Uncharacterized protein n=1 Tax=Pistacia integerrima TaxID=434235 RepID=A0ACC0Z633_9ROSI|nr:hypothetical protein Pint_05663 [Pistacia integerrima]
MVASTECSNTSGSCWASYEDEEKDSRRAEAEEHGRTRKELHDIFVCERVCTSKRMLKKVDALAKDPAIDTCVTVCGVSAIDACADACMRAVCVNQHQVPNWNDILGSAKIVSFY